MQLQIQFKLNLRNYCIPGHSKVNGNEIADELGTIDIGKH